MAARNFSQAHHAQAPADTSQRIPAMLQLVWGVLTQAQCWHSHRSELAEGQRKCLL